MVAVRAFDLDPATRLLPGDPIPAELPLFRKRSLWRRRMIAAADCAWTREAVAARAPEPAPAARPVRTKPLRVKPAGDSLPVLSDLEVSETE